MNTKRDWILNNFKCPVCDVSALPVNSGNSIVCIACKVSFKQDLKSLNFITPEIRNQFNIVPTKNVSAHGYDRHAMDLINSGKLVLDCGSGKKNVTYENLVQSDVVGYDNVDVLCVNQKLPFNDGIFDAVLSLAVLEHVDQPFDCAKEILRVLKPGGKIYAVVPFLQREHGYPHHYFGMTMMGLKRLFGDAIDIDSHHVSRSGHPIWALWMILQTYSSGLPSADRQVFNALRVEDIISKIPTDHLNKDYVLNLSLDAQRTIATTTSLHATKK